jgi:hypothetical protein
MTRAATPDEHADRERDYRKHEPRADHDIFLRARPCRHQWITDTTGLIDTCEICGEERA